MNIDKRIKAFVELGSFLRGFSNKGADQKASPLNALFYKDLEELAGRVHIHNPWFTEDNVRNAISALGDNLREEILLEWLSHYIKRLDTKKSIRVAVIMAGNVPMVGFQDMLCVLMSGNKFIGKLSSEDKFLLPFIGKILVAIEPELGQFIEFTEEKLKDLDAVIATGSNNSARYFEYYFGKYPHIIRKNRNSVAVLTGNETMEELRPLADDIFQYFGLGCRNVSKLFVPKGYIFDSFYPCLLDYSFVTGNNKYMNNYEYNRTVFLMSSDPTLLDNNFLLLKHDPSYASPVGVLYYEYYDDLKSLNERLNNDKELLQCIVSNSAEIKGALPFGMAQCPSLSDYADGIDTMEFLINL